MLVPAGRRCARAQVRTAQLADEDGLAEGGRKRGKRHRPGRGPMAGFQTSTEGETRTSTRNPWRAGRNSNPLGRFAPTRCSLIARRFPSGSKDESGPRNDAGLHLAGRQGRARSSTEMHRGRQRHPGGTAQAVRHGVLIDGARRLKPRTPGSLEGSSGAVRRSAAGRSRVLPASCGPAPSCGGYAR